MNQRADDELTFVGDSDDADDGNGAPEQFWKILIVDDEPAIHDVTLLALRGFEFGGKQLKFLHCYSGKEARQTIRDVPEIALILLDVVMETENEGLDVVRYVRNELKNMNVRIVLRTGQPGQAPERSVIVDYDINDYKEKTELTANRLFTLLHSSLRSYRDITAIEASRQGLGMVLEASAKIANLTSMNQFTQGVLAQITALLNLNPNAVIMSANGFATHYYDDYFEIIGGTGEFDSMVGKDAGQVLTAEIYAGMKKALKRRQHIYVMDAFFGYFGSSMGGANLVYMSGVQHSTQLERDMIEVFSRNVSIAFENIRLHQDMEATQREIVYLLGDAVETRSQETGNHVRRVAEFSKIIALEYGIAADEVEILKFASPLHDLGKIGVPDSILNKPGKHTEEEFEIMKTHAQIGRDMLSGSRRHILRTGAIIAGEHHERWDGQGYPNGIKGEEIHIYGRITAVADVFDALGSDRCYKKAWPLEKIIELMKQESGRQFDPALVDILLDKLDEIIEVQQQFPDRFES